MRASAAATSTREIVRLTAALLPREKAARQIAKRFNVRIQYAHEMIDHYTTAS